MDAYFGAGRWGAVGEPLGPYGPGSPGPDGADALSLGGTLPVFGLHMYMFGWRLELGCPGTCLRGMSRRDIDYN